MAAIQQLERLYHIQEGFAGDESLGSTVESYPHVISKCITERINLRNK